MNLRILDQSTPFILYRWLFCASLFLLYILRVWLLQGFYIVTYALGIYILNLIIGFLSPKIDPEFDIDMENDSPSELPTKNDSEFRPFIRRLPEFKFW